MPEIERITVNYSRKVQLDDFEPVRHSAEIEAALDADDDVDEVYDELSDRAEEMVERAIAARVSRKKLAGEDE